MKEQYIKQVEKELSLPRKMKKEVVRDLNEVFASAMEHGETEQQIIQRLGTPKEFADSTAEHHIEKKERYHFYSCRARYRGCCLFGICCCTIRKSTRRSNRTSRRDNKYTD